MNRHFIKHSTGLRTLLPALLASGTVVFALHAAAATLDLATAPLANSTTTTVKPNVMFVLDDSGSMTFTYMPDTVVNFHNNYGYQSNQCNSVYYNPAITYTPPKKADGTYFSNAVFTAAHDNGFDGTSNVTNLDNQFYANRFAPQSANTTYSGSSYKSYINYPLGQYSAVYYQYSGSATEKEYSDTNSTFYKECNSNFGSAPGSTVFSKRRLATTETTTISVSGSNSTSVSSIKVNGVELMSGSTTASSTASTVASRIAEKITQNGFSATSSGSVVTITGPTSAANHTPVITKSGSMTLDADVFPDTTPANLTNFANWYSFYRTRMLMMKTSAGQAFASLGDTYRVGLMKINSSSSPLVPVDVFENTQRSDWYTSLYNVEGNGGTPLRYALANAGRYFAGKLSGTDPIEYSCQQNFTILSTDGYWNGSAGINLYGTAIGNQDGDAERPMFDGTTTSSKWTLTYTRESYSQSTGCPAGKYKKAQPQRGTCTVTAAGGTCSPTNWTNYGSATTLSTCNYTSETNYSTAVLQETVLSDSNGTEDTLADVAMYYYKTDLRSSGLGNCSGAAGLDVCENNVFKGGSDNMTQQHMTTFTLGLGVSGRMTYSQSYLTDTSGDFVDVKLGSTASSSATPPVCSWQSNGTTCNWPVPSSDSVANIDDLWHAAVNGRGAYFSATDPTSLNAGLSNALASIQAKKGAGAAAASSTLNPVSGDNYAFVASYTTVEWRGNLEKRGVNTETGIVDENAIWCVENVAAGECSAPSYVSTVNEGGTNTAYCVTPNSTICTGGTLDGSNCKVPMAAACTGTMNSKVSASTDSRTIYTASSNGTSLIAFDVSYADANPGYFSGKLSSLSQWGALTEAQQAAATSTTLLKFLRGQNGYEDRSVNFADGVDNRLFRYRAAVLGDILESQPSYISKPIMNYPYPGYADYATAKQSRPGTIYVGANDGMLHAFAADTGIERWAYVPSAVVPQLWKLADKNYSGSHVNFVNGSPAISDVCVANCSNTAAPLPVWKTILVGGLNAGGRGYYAIDVTDPATPVLLWELTPETGIGKVKDNDIGFGYAQPIITRKADGTWVVLVTSGYNNVDPGTGKGFLYVLNASTGAIISKIGTDVGSTATPSGLSKITAWNDEPAGNKTSFVYGGDLEGNLWRFNINGTTAATIGTGDVLKFATLFSDDAGTDPQPITTTPVLGKIYGKRVVFVGTGKYLETADLGDSQVQSQYAIMDDDATSTLVNPRDTLVEQTITNATDGSATRVSSGSAVNFNSVRGWFFDFPDAGERQNVDSKLVQGVLLIPTTVPKNTVCEPGGYGWLTYVDYKTGLAINTTTNLVSTKFGAPIVGINVIYIEGKPVPWVVTSANPTPEKPEGPEFPPSGAAFTGKRVIWRELIP